MVALAAGCTGACVACWCGLAGSAGWHRLGMLSFPTQGAEQVGLIEPAYGLGYWYGLTR